MSNTKSVTLAATGLSFGAMFFLGVGISLIGAAARNIGLAAHEIGLLQTTQHLGFMVSVLLFGVMADSFPKPRLLFGGSLILAAGFFFFHRSPSLAFKAAMMFCMGVGFGSYEGTTDPLLLEVHSKRPGFIINLNHGFVTLGSIAIAAYLLILQFDWHKSVLQAAIVVLLLALGFGLLRLPQGSLEAPQLSERWQMLRKEPTVLILFIATTATMGFQIGSIGILTTYLMDFRGFNQVSSKTALILFNGGIVAGRILLGFITPRRHLYRTMTFMMGLTAAVSILIYGVDLGPYSYIPIFVGGMSVSIILPIIVTLGGLIYKKSAGTQAALWVFPGVIGVTFIVLVFGMRVIREPVVDPA